MCVAAAQALNDASRVLLMGVDCPGLSEGVLARALTRLESEDLVLGPAEDGGYVLLGLKRAEPRLFQGVDWGTDRVLAQTRERLRALGWLWHELPALWDLDRPADLARWDRGRLCAAHR
jgi:glycosyltransferase A (GT-A) superfamily protein (DUF2064 family)